MEKIKPRKKSKKSIPARILTAAVFICFALGALTAVINAVVVISTKDDIDGDAPGGCILILGAGLRDDGTPSDMLRDRLDTGIALYKSGAGDKIIVSGDHGRKDYNEVGAMKRYCVEQGVQSGDVFMDHAGFSTYESIYRAKEIFGVDSMIIVTQKYHLYRAVYTAQRFGLEAEGVSADAHTYGGQLLRDAREYVARCKDFVYCVFKPEPTYLGDRISLGTGGDVTNDN